MSPGRREWAAVRFRAWILAGLAALGAGGLLLALYGDLGSSTQQHDGAELSDLPSPDSPSLRGADRVGRGTQEHAESTEIETAAARRPALHVVGRVLLTGAAVLPEGRFVVLDEDTHKLLSHGEVGAEGHFEASVTRKAPHLVKAHRSVSIIVTLAGQGHATASFDVPDDGVIEATLTVEARPSMHGMVVDTDGRPVPAVRMIWIQRGLVHSLRREEADPVDRPARWVSYEYPPWCVSGADGRFQVAGVDPKQKMPQSMMAAWELSMAVGPAGNLHDPVTVVARSRIGVVVHVIDETTRTAVEDPDGWGVLRVNGRARVQGVMHGSGSRLKLLAGSHGENVSSSSADILVLAEGYVPHREHIDVGGRRRPRRIEVSMKRATGAGAPRRVVVQHEGLKRFRDRMFVLGRRILRLGDAADSIRVEQSIGSGSTFSLQPGSHTLVFYEDTVRSCSRIAPWQVDVVVPQQGEPQVTVVPPRLGTLHLLVEGTKHSGLSLVVVESPSGAKTLLKAASSASGGTRLRDVPAGRCHLELYRSFGSGGITMYERVEVEIAEGTETVLTLR